MALNAFFNQIISGVVKIAVIGSGCSLATEPTAEISHYYNITHVREYTFIHTSYSQLFLGIHKLYCLLIIAYVQSRKDLMTSCDIRRQSVDICMSSGAEQLVGVDSSPMS